MINQLYNSCQNQNCRTGKLYLSAESTSFYLAVAEPSLSFDDRYDLEFAEVNLEPLVCISPNLRPRTPGAAVLFRPYPAQQPAITCSPASSQAAADKNESRSRGVVSSRRRHETRVTLFYRGAQLEHDVNVT
jgi:hypothetical protein